jgi:hypothetical protein
VRQPGCRCRLFTRFLHAMLKSVSIRRDSEGRSPRCFRAAALNWRNQITM